jgi:4-coumarate--CoA ligase
MSPMLFYGIITAGGVYSPSNLSSTAADLARQIRQGDSRLIICSDDTKEVALEAARICGLPISRILMLQSKPVPKLMTLEDGVDVISDQELDWEKITGQEELESTLVCLLYSSGTSGLPKGMLFQYRSIPELTNVHSRLHVSLQSGSADCSLWRKSSRAFPSPRGPRPEN